MYIIVHEYHMGSLYENKPISNASVASFHWAHLNLPVCQTGGYIMYIRRDPSHAAYEYALSDKTSTSLREEEPQTVYPMSFTWASHIAPSVIMGC